MTTVSTNTSILSVYQGVNRCEDSWKALYSQQNISAKFTIQYTCTPYIDRQVHIIVLRLYSSTPEEYVYVDVLEILFDIELLD